VRQPSRRPSALLLCALAVQSACHNTQRLELPAAGGPTTVAAGALVRVRLADGSDLALADVRVIGDSLVGRANASRRRRLAVAVADVRGMDRRQLDPGRTVLATAAGVLGVMLVNWLRVTNAQLSGLSTPSTR
jgi:hypothetical protein